MPKPKYLYARCDNGTQFLFSRNEPASKIAGDGWFKYSHMDAWMSQIEHNRLQDEQERWEEEIEKEVKKSKKLNWFERLFIIKPPGTTPEV